MDILEQALKLIGRPVADSSFEEFVAAVGETPEWEEQELQRICRFPGHGLQLSVNRQRRIVFAVDAQVEIWRPDVWTSGFNGVLPKGILRTDSREDVERKIGAKVSNSVLNRSTADRESYYWTDFYHLAGGDSYNAEFDARTEKLIGIGVAHGNFMPTGGASFRADVDVNDPAAFVRNVMDVYAGCSSYQDEGSVVVEFSPGAEDSFTVKKIWRTLFRRPDCFLFEWVEVYDNLHEHALENCKCLREDVNAICWFEGTRVDSFLGKRRELKSVAAGLDSQAGVSSGASCLVPSMLIPDLMPEWSGRLKEVQPVRLHEPEPHDAVIGLSGIDRTGDRMVALFSLENLTLRALTRWSIQTGEESDMMVRAALATIQNDPIGEYANVRAEIEKNLARGPEDLETITKYSYSNVVLDGEIPDSRFRWEPYRYSDFEWARRGLG